MRAAQPWQPEHFDRRTDYRRALGRQAVALVGLLLIAALLPHLLGGSFDWSGGAERQAVVRGTVPGVTAAPQAQRPPEPVLAVPALAVTEPLRFTTAPPGAAAQVAIAFAMAHVGVPYVWGGNGPANGDAGFDCSGLTTAAYAAAGIDLPRTAHTQYYRGPQVPLRSPLLPGDLVFYGVPARVHHVGLYIGDGRMVNAPTFGKPVQIASVRWAGDDYLGATRPAAAPGSIQLGPVVAALVTPPGPLRPAPTEFLAPPAPQASLSTTPPGSPPPSAEALAGMPPAGAPAGAPPAAGVSIGPPPTATGPPPGPPPPATSTPSVELPPTTTPPITTPSAIPPAGPTPPPPGPLPAQPALPPTTDPPPATVAVPTRLSVPGLTSVALLGTRLGTDGLPPEPAAGTGSRWMSTGGPPTIVIVLAPGALAGAPSVGMTISLRYADGTSSSYRVTSRATMSSPAAASRVSASSSVLRVLLLATDPASGQVVVVQAR